MSQEIWNISILYPKKSKEFYHHIKRLKIIMNRRCSIEKRFLKFFPVFTRKYICWGLVLIKMQTFRLFKISNSNNLFKQFSAISLKHNKSLIICSSHNDKKNAFTYQKPVLIGLFCNRFRKNIPLFWNLI